MGLTVSLLQKFGLPGVQSLSTDKLFDTFFNKEEINSFENFHIAFIDLCNAFNKIMPGKHVKVPPFEEIKKCYDQWKTDNKDGAKMDKLKNKLEELLTTESKLKEDGAMVVAGMVAPTAAMVLKKTGENVPQLKKFRLSLIPDVVFVPSCTVLALIGVKVLQINMTSK